MERLVWSALNHDTLRAAAVYFNNRTDQYILRVTGNAEPVAIYDKDEYAEVLQHAQRCINPPPPIADVLRNGPFNDDGSPRG